MLIDTVDPALKVSTSLLITVSLFVGIIAAGAVWLVIKAAKRQVTTGDEGLIGKIAEVRNNGMVYVDGALWSVLCDTSLESGEKVEVVGVDKLKLKVKKSCFPYLMVILLM